MSYTIFISDTHLGNIADGNVAKRLIDCIKSHEHKLSTLYLLGDIFNIWVGDEQKDQPEIQDFLNYIIELSSKNIQVFIMHGNRDFLMGKTLCHHLKCKLLPDPYIIYLNNNKILLTHGDLLCTDDGAYQTLRKILHNKIIQKVFLAMPYKLRYAIAMYIRRLSIKKQISKLKNINYNKIDINMQELENWYKKYKFDTIIHGHTHNSALHKYKNYNRIVLSDWHEDGGVYAVFDNENLYLKKYHI